MGIRRSRADTAGRITGIGRNGAAESYAYDGLDRLIEVRSPHEHRRFAYDAVGNRTALRYADSLTVEYRYYRNDWLKTVYDPEGNRTAYQRDGVGLMANIALVVVLLMSSDSSTTTSEWGGNAWVSACSASIVWAQASSGVRNRPVSRNLRVMDFMLI